MQTYLFYDIETTGLSKPFDQVLQFAAIRTDKAFKELERYNISVTLNSGVIPSPYATITHQIGLSHKENALNEYDAIKKIHTIMNTPGTISLGYNTLGFDDEFLRFSFYRNLLTPYTHQYANQCARMDIYPMTVMYFLFKPGVIHWPEKNDRPSLKLEEINRENNLAKGQAHDAMVDVEATLALAKAFKKEPDMWIYLENFFSKKDFTHNITKIHPEFSIANTHYREALLINGNIGSKMFYQAPVLSLGNHTHYKNQSLWLRLDTQDLSKTTLNNPGEHAWVTQIKTGEPGFILPTLERFTKYLEPKRQKQTEHNKAWLAKNPDIFHAIKQHYQEYTYPTHPNVDVDAALYIHKFWTDADVMLCHQFHNATPAEKSALINTMPNEHLQDLAVRLLGKHYPDALNNTQQEQFDDYIKHAHASQNNAMINFKNEKRMTIEQALQDIAELREKKTLDQAQETLLLELENYISAIPCEITG